MIKNITISLILLASAIVSLQSEVRKSYSHFSSPLRLDTDLFEQDDNIVARMQVPGINPDNIEVSIENNILRVSGKREEEKEVKEKNYYSREIKQGSFERVLTLPQPIDVNNAMANYKNGELTVVMPKKVSRSEGKVKITVNKN